jgi:hypothetical protein
MKYAYGDICWDVVARSWTWQILPEYPLSRLNKLDLLPILRLLLSGCSFILRSFDPASSLGFMTVLLQSLPSNQNATRKNALLPAKVTELHIFFRFRLFATVALAHARGEQGTLSLRILTLILR